MNIETFNTNLIDNLTDDTIRRIIKDFKMPFGFINRRHFKDMIANIAGVAPEYHDAIVIMVNISTKIPPEFQSGFYEYVHTTLDYMVNIILDSAGYPSFNGQRQTESIDDLFPLKQMNIPTGDHYNHEYANDTFISIDLENAAFQALKLWDTMYGESYGYIIGRDVKCYDDFVRVAVDRVFNMAMTGDHISNDYMPVYTDMMPMVVMYLEHCKSLRQVVFGKTNPKRIQHIEKYIIQTLVRVIAYSTPQDMEETLMPIRINNDEVVYRYTEYMDNTIAFCPNIIFDKLEFRGSKATDTPIRFHKNLYTLKEYSLKQCGYAGGDGLKPIRFFVKQNRAFGTHLAQAPEFKCLPTTVYLIARALINGNMKMARFFETQPIVIDGMIHWLAIPTCLCHPEGDNVDINTWELRENIHNMEIHNPDAGVETEPENDNE